MVGKCRVEGVGRHLILLIDHFHSFMTGREIGTSVRDVEFIIWVHLIDWLQFPQNHFFYYFT